MSAVAIPFPGAVAVATPITFSVPFAELAEFAALPEARRTEIHYTLTVLERLHVRIASSGKMQALAETAALHKHAMKGLSEVSLARKYGAYIARDDEGKIAGWRTLIKGYKAPSKQPSTFVQEVRRLAEMNHRSSEEAFQQLRESWARGDDIPGWGTWMNYFSTLYPERPLPKVWPRGFYPIGWSVRNLRRYGPSKGARMLYQQGFAASKKLFPSVIRDTSELRPLEKIVIDDFQLNSNCTFPGDAKHAPEIAPVAGLMAMCVGTRRKLTWGLGAMILRDEKQPDGTIKKVRSGIRRVDVQMLIYAILAKYGLPDYPITIICENATASIAPELRLALETLFESRIRIETTGLINHKTLVNGFVERGGKPWEKGWIESTFNKLWNIMGAAPGYKGSNARLNGPADIDAKIQYTKILIGQGEGKLNLSPEQIVKLRLPFPSPAELERAFSWACEVSDSRTDHKYLGFDVVTEYLLEPGGEPQPIEALALFSPEQQNSDVIPVERFESPTERWMKGCQKHTFHPIPQSVLALLLLTPKQLTWKKYALTFTHNKVGYSYVDETNTVMAGVAEGTDFLCYVDLNAPGQIYVADMKGAYVGTLNRLGGNRGMVDVRDTEALSIEGGKVRMIVNRTQAELRERHAAEDIQLAADRAHNDAIVAEHKAETAGMTNAEKIGHAAGEAAQQQAEERAQAKVRQRQQAADDRAAASRRAKITEEDAAAFLGGDVPAAPLSTAAPTTDGHAASLDDYLS